MIHWCAIGEEDDTKKKWEVLRIIYLGSSHNGISNIQLAQSTEDESGCTRLQVAGVSHRPESCSKLVPFSMFSHRDT